MTLQTSLPGTIADVECLEEVLSRPSNALVESLGALDGDLLVLGAGGKMGPSLCRMAVRAFQAAGKTNRVHAASRFGDAGLIEKLERHGVRVLRGDLMDENFLSRLPDTRHVINLVGMKFGTSRDPSKTWAWNNFLTGLLCRRCRESRMTVMSTGNVYGDVDVESGGSKVDDVPNPQGEYAMSCLGKERLCQYFSNENKTPMTIIRLNYACELRYGVLVDVAVNVLEGRPIDLSTGYLNTIWQGNANEFILRAMELCEVPARMINLTGPDILEVRRIAQMFGERFGTAPIFQNKENRRALLNDASWVLRRYGTPSVSLNQMVDWIAHWLKTNGVRYGKPTRFEVRDGKF